jgi:hypothetical protein
MLVGPPFIRHIHRTEPHRQGTDDRGEEISHREPRRKDRNIFVKNSKHNSKAET